MTIQYAQFSSTLRATMKVVTTAPQVTSASR